MQTSTPSRYSTVAILLHWLMALGLFGAFAAGLYIDELPKGLARLKLINWHKWAGVSLLALALLRLVWRATHRPPADLPAPAWQQRAAHAVHLLLYLLMLAVPLLGWLFSSAAGYPVVWFGVLPLPDLVGPDKALAHQLKEMHEAAAWLLALLVLAHLGAALKHQFIDRDGLLDRMRPGSR